MERSAVISVVHNLLVEQVGQPRKPFSLSDRLERDLGLTGDDADEFFDRVHECFGTDFTKLLERWTQHFDPEGLSPWLLIGFFLVAMSGSTVADAIGLSGLWALVIVIPMLLALVLAFQRWPRNRRAPITVGEVVAAVERGSWM